MWALRKLDVELLKLVIFSREMEQDASLILVLQVAGSFQESQSGNRWSATSTTTLGEGVLLQYDEIWDVTLDVVIHLWRPELELDKLATVVSRDCVVVVVVLWCEHDVVVEHDAETLSSNRTRFAADSVILSVSSSSKSSFGSGRFLRGNGHLLLTWVSIFSVTVGVIPIVTDSMLNSKRLTPLVSSMAVSIETSSDTTSTCWQTSGVSSPNSKISSLPTVPADKTYSVLTETGTGYV